MSVDGDRPETEEKPVTPQAVREGLRLPDRGGWERKELDYRALAARIARRRRIDLLCTLAGLACLGIMVGAEVLWVRLVAVLAFIALGAVWDSLLEM